MEPRANEALTDAVRRLARPTTPDELKRRGVSSVRSLSLSRVAALIDKAVNRTMIARTLGEADDDVQEFSVHARQEFLAMLRGDEEGELASERQVEAQARGALDKLETELAERRAAVEAERSALSQVGGEVGAADDDLTRKLRNRGGSARQPRAARARGDRPRRRRAAP